MSQARAFTKNSNPAFLEKNWDSAFDTVKGSEDGKKYVITFMMLDLKPTLAKVVRLDPQNPRLRHWNVWR